MWTQIKLWIFSKPQKSPNIPLLWLIWGTAVPFQVTALALLHSSSPLGKVSYPQSQTCSTSFLTAPNPQESLMSDSLWSHGLYSPWNSPGQNTGVGSLSLLQGIFPTQGLNPGLLGCRWILYQLSHKESSRILEWVAYPFSRGSSRPRNQTRVSWFAGGFFTNWAIREASLNPLLNFYTKSFLIPTYREPHHYSWNKSSATTRSNKSNLFSYSNDLLMEISEFKDVWIMLFRSWMVSTSCINQ